MMNTRFTMTLVCMSLMCVCPASVWAQASDETEDDREMAAQSKAIEKMKEGTRHFNDGEYGRAIEAWTESFYAYPSGFAMLNVAKAYVELERFDDARVAIDTARGNRDYLALPLDQAGLIDVQTLERQIETLEEEAAQRKLAEQRAARIKTCREGKGRLNRLGKGGLVGTGVGSLFMLGALPFAIRARGQLDALTPPHTQGRAQYEQDVEALESTQRIGKILLYSGAGIALTGVGLFAFDMTTQEYPYEDCDTLLKSGSAQPSAAQLMVGAGQVHLTIRF